MNRTWMMTTLLALALGGLGCPAEKGPMEKAGEKVDKAAEDLKESVEKDGPMEKVGEKIDEAAEDVADAVKGEGDKK